MQLVSWGVGSLNGFTPLPLAFGAPNIEGCLTKFVAAVPTGLTDRARDRELLARVAQGDVAALRSIYDQHASRAITIAFRILRNREEAEDVVQETFLEVWRRAAQFDPGRGGAVAWVVTIARSRAIDRLRARNIAGRTIGSAAEGDGVLMPVSPPSPAAETERRRDERRVAEALVTLPPAQRRTIELAYFEGLSQSEIAVKTASPLGTVKMRVKLAMAKLAELLGDEST
jgi:RNA polymerase sigma-70 factor, ECF subfamily